MIMEGATISSLVYVEIEFNRDVIQMPRRYSCSPGVGILGLLCILQMFKMQEISLHIARKCSGCFFEKAKQTGRSACRQDLCHKIQFHLHEKKTTRLQGGIFLPHLGGGDQWWTHNRPYTKFSFWGGGSLAGLFQETHWWAGYTNNQSDCFPVDSSIVLLSWKPNWKVLVNGGGEILAIPAQQCFQTFSFAFVLPVWLCGAGFSLCSSLHSKNNGIPSGLLIPNTISKQLPPKDIDVICQMWFLYAHVSTELFSLPCSLQRVSHDKLASMTFSGWLFSFGK